MIWGEGSPRQAPQSQAEKGFLLPAGKNQCGGVMVVVVEEGTADQRPSFLVLSSARLSREATGHCMLGQAEREPAGGERLPRRAEKGTFGP